MPSLGNHVDYIIAKIAGVEYVKHYMEDYGMQGIILRGTCINRGYHGRYADFHKGSNIANYTSLIVHHLKI
ncbi:unnamed protein product [marine sediment metagenome]|uniref:Uncharacterized protein n=1 Tax=marine sediment metagenome TaxID=412755 RepID=X1L2U5_9ZZZZ